MKIISVPNFIWKSSQYQISYENHLSAKFHMKVISVPNFVQNKNLGAHTNATHCSYRIRMKTRVHVHTSGAGRKRVHTKLKFFSCKLVLRHSRSLSRLHVSSVIRFHHIKFLCNLKFGSYHPTHWAQISISYKIFILYHGTLVLCKLRFCHTSIPTSLLFTCFIFNLIPLHLIPSHSMISNFHAN